MPSNPNQANRPVKSADRRVVVELACGCKVKVRGFPLNERATYPCPGAGHGYRQDWVAYTDGDTGLRRANPKHNGQNR